MFQIIYLFNIISFLAILSLLGLPIIIATKTTKGAVCWIFAKLLGFLIYSYIVWILSHIKYLNSSVVISVSLILVSTPIILNFIKTRKTLIAFFKKNWLKIIGIELLFLFYTASYLFYRYINPQVEGIEKFMDQAIINSLVKALNMPPIDMWFSQTPLQYYYFGQYLFAVLIKTLNTPLDIAYNLSISVSFGLAMLMATATLFLMTKSKFWAFLGSIVILLAGNLDYAYKTVLQNKQNYFFAEARSLVEFVITEFPAYSYILGDLHAHLINIPLVLMYISFLYLMFKNKTINNTFLLISGFVLGILFMINSWDYIVYSLLTFLVFLAKTIKYKNFTNFTYLLKIGIVSIITLLLFKINFNAPVTGIGINTKLTPLLPLFLMFGHFFIIGVIGCLLFLKLKVKALELKFSVFLFSFGILLILLAEIFFIKDIYFTANPPYFRANTVFKIWYQAFIVLGISSIIFVKQIANTKKVSAYILLIPIITAFVFNLKYTAVSGFYYYFKGSKYDNYTLNGLQFLEKVNLKNEKEAIYFLNKNVKTQSFILEKPGDAYTTDSLFSVFTGNPTLVGWSNHEFGWQGEWDKIAKTITDIDTIYTNSDTETVKNLLKKYKIEYVIIGSKETEKYGINAGETLKTIGREFYKNDTVTIVKIY